MFARIRVRDTRTGAVRHLFTGSFGIEGFTRLPRWEGSRGIVFLATAPRDATPVTRMAWVRCSLAGACRDTSPVFAVDLDKPPYGPSPWVLADQRLR